MVLVALLLLGTCVGFRGSVGRSGGRRGLSGGLLAARRPEKSLERSRDWSRGPRRAPTRFVALRRPALAVWRGVETRGRQRGAFFELLKQVSQTRRLDDQPCRGFAHSQLGCRSKRCVGCLERWCPPWLRFTAVSNLCERCLGLH